MMLCMLLQRPKFTLLCVYLYRLEGLLKNTNSVIIKSRLSLFKPLCSFSVFHTAFCHNKIPVKVEVYQHGSILTSF